MLDRDKARTVLAKSTLVDMTNDEILDEIEACLVSDPRITRIEELPVYRQTSDSLGWISADAVEAILRSDD